MDALNIECLTCSAFGFNRAPGLTHPPEPARRDECRHISAKPRIRETFTFLFSLTTPQNPAAWSAASKLPTYNGPPALHRQCCEELCCRVSNNM